MNSIVLSGEVLTAAEVRYTQDNLAVSSLLLSFPNQRGDEAPFQVWVAAFGELAQTLADQSAVGQQLIVEGQLHINSIERDGKTEKRAEISARRIYHIGGSALVSINPGFTAEAASPTPSAKPASIPSKSPVRTPAAKPAPRTDDLDLDEVPF